MKLKDRRITTSPYYAEIYRNAAKELRQRGWCHQGALGEEGEICLYMALTIASADLPEEEMRRPANAVARRIEPNGRNNSAYAVIQWNDAPERTQEEVFALLAEMAR